MPEKIIDISKTTINIIYLASVCISLFSVIGVIITSYAFFVIKTFKEKFDELKSFVKEELIKNDSMHKDHYDRIHDNDTILQVTKTTLDKHIIDCRDIQNKKGEKNGK